MGESGPGVLRLPCDPCGPVVALGAQSHGAVVELAVQPVVHHRVDQAAVAHPVAGARSAQEIRGLAHRLHAAGHDHLCLSGGDEQVGQVDRVQAGQADLVHRGGRNRHGDARLGCRLTGGDLALASLENVSHEHVIDVCRGDGRAIQDRRDRQASELHGAEAGERARELANRGTYPCEDDGTCHCCLRRSGAASADRERAKAQTCRLGAEFRGLATFWRFEPALGPDGRRVRAPRLCGLCAPWFYGYGYPLRPCVPSGKRSWQE